MKCNDCRNKEISVLDKGEVKYNTRSDKKVESKKIARQKESNLETNFPPSRGQLSLSLSLSLASVENPFLQIPKLRI